MKLEYYFSSVIYDHKCKTMDVKWAHNRKSNCNFKNEIWQRTFEVCTLNNGIVLNIGWECLILTLCCPREITVHSSLASHTVLYTLLWTIHKLFTSRLVISHALSDSFVQSHINDTFPLMVPCLCFSVCVCVSLSVSLSLCLSLSLHLSFFVSLFILLCLNLSLSLYIYIYIYISMSLCLYISLPV